MNQRPVKPNIKECATEVVRTATARGVSGKQTGNVPDSRKNHEKKRRLRREMGRKFSGDFDEREREREGQTNRTKERRICRGFCQKSEGGSIHGVLLINGIGVEVGVGPSKH